LKGEKKGGKETSTGRSSYLSRFLADQRCEEEYGHLLLLLSQTSRGETRGKKKGKRKEKKRVFRIKSKAGQTRREQKRKKKKGKKKKAASFSAIVLGSEGKGRKLKKIKKEGRGEKGGGGATMFRLSQFYPAIIAKPRRFEGTEREKEQANSLHNFLERREIGATPGGEKKKNAGLRLGEELKGGRRFESISQCWGQKKRDLKAKRKKKKGTRRRTIQPPDLPSKREKKGGKGGRKWQTCHAQHLYLLGEFLKEKKGRRCRVTDPCLFFVTLWGERKRLQAHHVTARGKERKGGGVGVVLFFPLSIDHGQGRGHAQKGGKKE